jgi:hypothetical protein
MDHGLATTCEHSRAPFNCSGRLCSRVLVLLARRPSISLQIGLCDVIPLGGCSILIDPLLPLTPGFDPGKNGGARIGIGFRHRLRSTSLKGFVSLIARVLGEVCDRLQRLAQCRLQG